MGCGAAKNIQISNNLAFSNGKIVEKEGNYFLERNRYHDKLLPKVQKRFENFISKQIEGLGNEANAAHEHKPAKNNANKRKSKYSGK